MSRIPRRRFVCLLVGGGTSLVAAAPLLTPPYSSSPEAQNVQSSAMARVTRTSWALGSSVTITAMHENQSVAALAIDEAFAELETVEQVMSIYRAESQLCRLNRFGLCEDPHPYLVEVLQSAVALSRRTDGAFDVTIQPLWQAYWQAHVEGRRPTDDEIVAARRLVNWRNIEIKPNSIRFTRSGTAVTLNGIAQGFAADRATIALRRHGIQHALIDTGEFGSLGEGSDGDGWNVGIQHPRRADAFVAVANLAGRCLATSGDYATTFDKTFTAHHLLDPRTGRSSSELSSVSVVANSGLESDALSTAVFVLGLDAGRKLIAATPRAAALIVSKDGRTWASPEFPVQGKVKARVS